MIESLLLSSSSDLDKFEEPSTESQDPSVEVSTNRARRAGENSSETVAVSPPQKRELHTRNGRRVRCNRFIWKHLCADKKSDLYKRRSVPTKKPDPMTENDQNTSEKLAALSSDTNDTSIEPTRITRNSKKRKTTDDITNEEHIVPKRRMYGRRAKGNRQSLDETSLSTIILF